MHQLIGMYYSPWTERARWAVDYHRLPHRYTEYTTMLGEPLLRLRAGKWLGKVSVPLLLTPDGPVNDSFRIAAYADRHSTRAPLVPPAREAAIADWVNAAELALCSARIRATRRIGRSTGALAERLPAYVPDPLRTPMIPMAFVATRYILAKYDLKDADDAQLFRHMDAFFDRADRALQGRESLFETFGFADMVVATALQALTPVDDRYIPLGPASRQCMCEPELAGKYASLIAWRDRTYENLR
ncbi:MAG: glutathione S-transferase N-terminal domain-containing protein [Pseudomonadota bacterium]